MLGNLLSKRILFVAAFAAVVAPVGLNSQAGGETVPCLVDANPASALVCADLVVDQQRMGITNVISRTFTASSCAVQEGSATVGTHRLLRFVFTTPNIGTADLVVGSPGQHPEWFEWGACHGHYHFRQYADYRLWTPAGWAQWDALRTSTPSTTLSLDLLAANPDIRAQMVAGDKRGFCVIDLRGPYTPTVGVPHPPKYFSCGNQGISVGWADEYFYTLDGQWVVVTGLSGTFVLEAEVNAEHLYQELNYANNRAHVTVNI